MKLPRIGWELPPPNIDDVRSIPGLCIEVPDRYVGSAEGITTYAGFQDDEASVKARTWLVTRITQRMVEQEQIIS